MAFNPLRMMRKHQKVLMAGVVLVCMVTFILSSGSMGGDFFDWLKSKLTGRSNFPEVATLYGERIDIPELQRLRQRRIIANEYMGLAHNHAMSVLQEDIKRATEEAKKKPGDSSLLQKQLDARTKLSQLEPRQPQGQLYFGGTLGPEELLDFLIWKKQADRLGIHLSATDVARERDQETVIQLPRDVLRNIEVMIGSLRTGEPLTADLLVSSLADEFRVRLAKTALLGPDAPPQRNPFGMGFDPTGGRLQTSFTPEEFWEFYRRNRTEISVRLLPVAARDLLPQIKDTPEESALRELFDKHSNDEPNPMMKRPGFKQPRRIQVEWVSASPKDEPYPRAAELSLAVLEATLPLAFTEQLLTEYNQSKSRFRLPSWTEEQSGKALLPAFKQQDFETMRKLHALPVQRLADAILMAALGSAQAREIALDLKALGGWVDTETKARKEFLASALALTAMPLSPLLLTGVPALSVAARQHSGDRFGQVLPLTAVTRYLFKELRDDMARRLVNKNLEAFSKELDKYRGRPEDAKKFVAESLKRYGLKSGAMAQPRDQFGIAEDPALQPIKEPLRSRTGVRLEDDPRERVIGFLLFQLNKTYAPQRAFSNDETNYLYWMTADKAAYVPKFEEVKDEVLAAWRLNKARELAKAEADKVADAAKKAGRDALRTLIDGSPHSGKPIELYGVTRLKPPDQSPLPGRDRQYTPYRLPATEIEFPTQEFVDKLLELKDFGDVAVLHDMPEGTYYVATPLSKRSEPLPGEFYAVYKRTSPAEVFPDPLLTQFDRQRRADQKRAVMEQLRADARLKLDNDGIKALADERQ